MSLSDRIRGLLPGGGGRRRETAPAGLVPADKLAAQARRDAARGSAAAGPAGAADRELLAQRDRLVERFTMMQADLGGVLYEMVIRDHVRMDVLTRKAAELQRVEADLAHVQHALRGEPAPPVGGAGGVHVNGSARGGVA